MHLGGRGVASEHRDEGGWLDDCRGHRRAEGVQMGFGAVQGCVCYLDLVLHGIQPCHMQEDHSLSAVMVPDLFEIVLTVPYSLCGRGRTPQRS